MLNSLCSPVGALGILRGFLQLPQFPETSGVVIEEDGGNRLVFLVQSRVVDSAPIHAFCFERLSHLLKLQTPAVEQDRWPLLSYPDPTRKAGVQLDRKQQELANPNLLRRKQFRDPASNSARELQSRRTIPGVPFARPAQTRFPFQISCSSSATSKPFCKQAIRSSANCGPAGNSRGPC